MVSIASIQRLILNKRAESGKVLSEISDIRELFMLRVFSFASLFLLGTTSVLVACPMADKSYVYKIDGWLTTRFYFNEECTEVVQNYRGNITRHKLSAADNGWAFAERDGRYRWIVSSTGRSARFFGPEWSVTGRLVRTKNK